MNLRTIRSTLVCVSLAGCTQSGLQAIDDVQVNVVDNLLEIDGQVCTDPPEATDFPVKVLFLIDGSGSMQFIDPFSRRALAVEETVLRLRSNPSVSYAIVRFNDQNVVLTKPGAAITSDEPESVDLSGSFTRDPGILRTAVQGLQIADSVTDYQGTLATAYRILAQDMLAAPPAELKRTKYVVLFMSDGDPFPDCCSAQSQAEGLCTPPPNGNIFFCEDPDALRGQLPNGNSTLPYLVAGEDYNQPYQIYASARDIMDLAANLGAGELRIHTAFLFDTSLVPAVNPATGCYEIGGVSFACPAEARMLLGEIARIGDGVFRDFSRAEEVDFLGFDLTNIRRENAMKNLLVYNKNLKATPSGLVVDSDGDGIEDRVEFEAGMNQLSWDSDGDGYSDALEYRLKRGGLDPTIANPGCTGADDRDDLDADGLLTCEELVLRTSTDLYDTDADGMPDGLELVVGGDPSVTDGLADSDLDGVRNGDEVRTHTLLGFNEANQRPDLAYRYKTDDLGVNEQGEHCYDFRIKNVQLGTPLAQPGRPATYGLNETLVYMAQAPFDDPNDFGSYKVACVRARYVAPDFKDPPSGRVTLEPADFKLPEDLDLDADCVGLTPPAGVAP